MAANRSGPTQRLVDNLFRREGSRIVSMLTRIFGIERLELAEDVVQEALLKALQQWPYAGIPDNPSGWIMQVAKNRALDILRREKSYVSKEKDLAGALDSGQSDSEALFLDHEIGDDQLRMLFACCHPNISPESQIALMLKILCGFSIPEISHAFLSAEETIHKRIVRAKVKLRELRGEFEIPSGPALAPRIDTVMRALYLLFNEGYSASGGDRLIRNELCEEAIRLTRQLTSHSAGDRPETHALLALMLLHAARFPSRTDAPGHLILLKDQDRSLWETNLITEGLQELGRSAGGQRISEYHLQAGIAACHCLAKRYEDTDWQKILTLYDMLAERDKSPVLLLNRAVAVARIYGPEAGIRAIGEIEGRKQLEGYFLLYAVLGEFFLELGDPGQAADHFHKALNLTGVTSEQLFLSEKLDRALTQLRNRSAG